MDTKKYEELQAKISELHKEIKKLRDKQHDIEMEDVKKTGITVGDYIALNQESEPIVYMHITDMFRDFDTIFFNGEKFYYSDDPSFEPFAMWGSNEQCHVCIDNIDDEVTKITKEEFESELNEMIYSIKENHKTIKLDNTVGDC